MSVREAHHHPHRLRRARCHVGVLSRAGGRVGRGARPLTLIPTCIQTRTGCERRAKSWATCTRSSKARGRPKLSAAWRHSARSRRLGHMHIAVDDAHLDTHRRSWRHALAQAHILAQARRSCRSRTGAHPCTGNAHRRGAHVAHAQALMAHTRARTSTRTASTVTISVGVDMCGWRGLAAFGLHGSSATNAPRQRQTFVRRIIIIKFQVYYYY